MTELRFVSREGDFLVLETASGDRYLVPVDEALREGVRNSARAVSATTPREIQALVREGLTVSEIAAKTGESEEFIELFAPAVRDEIAYLLETALQVEIADGTQMTGFQSFVAKKSDVQGWKLAKIDQNWILSAEVASGSAQWKFNPRDLSLEATNQLARDISRAEQQVLGDSRPAAVPVTSPQHNTPPAATTSPTANAGEDAAKPAASVLDLVEEIKKREGAEGAKPASAKGRAALPSWDEIVSGTSHPDEEF